jgi:hypothetical protein
VEKLGLKLEARKAPIEVRAIESSDKTPRENQVRPVWHPTADLVRRLPNRRRNRGI